MSTLAAIAESPPLAARAPIRVAYIVHGLEIGGIERSVSRLVNGLDRDRFEPAVVCLGRSGPAADWIERDDVPIIELHKRSGRDWRVIGRLARVLHEHRIDIVHSHNWGTLVETVVARRRARVPVHIHAERGTICGGTKPGSLRQRLRAAAMRWALNRADCVVSNAASVARRVEEACGFPADRVRIIPNGVEAPAVADPVAARREIRAELGISEEAFVVGSVGRLVPVKGFDLAIEAVARLCDAGEDVHLVLVGDGPEADALQRQANSSGIANRVRFAGHREDVGRWLAAIDLYVNSSRSEGMSQSLAEAMAAGLPIVATDAGDNRILVNGERPCGRVVTAEAPDLSHAIAEMIGSPQELRQSGREARCRIDSEYTLERMLQRFGNLYSAAVVAGA